ncbi:MAG: bifunctional metallophosphatase/5'-nucleotidase [Burkholderiaceae bacterium]
MKFHERGNVPWATLAAASLAATVLMTAGGCAAPGGSAGAAKAEPVRLLAFNDFHGHLEKGSLSLMLPDPADATKMVSVRTGGGAFLAGKIDELRAAKPANTLVVSSGDLIGGSPLISAFFRDEPTIELMNAMKIDINVVGNHEFDKGITELRRMVAGGCNTDTSDPNLSSCSSKAKTYTGAKFDFLAANVEDASGKPVYPPYVIKTVGAQKIAFVGVVTRTTPTIVLPAGVAGLKFKDEAETINKYVPEIVAKGVRAIVAVVHEGGVTDSTWNDTACANARGEIFNITDKLNKEVDIVLSGHTHQGYNCVRNGMRLVQSFAFGRGIAQLDFEIGADGNIDQSKLTAVNLPVVNDANTDPAIAAKFPAAPSNAAAKAIVDEYAALAAPRANRDIGQISGTVDRTAAPGGDHPAGRLIADAQLAATKAADKGGAQISFMNAGGIRADFVCATPPCNVTFGQAFTVQPFGNSLVVMTLTGQQIKDLLEQQWSGANAARARILQPSAGFTYSWDNAAAAGAKVSNMMLNGTPISLSANYRVAVNSFIAEGGDGYTTLIAGASRLGGAQDIDALIAYFAANRPYAPATAARITRIN